MPRNKRHIGCNCSRGTIGSRSIFKHNRFIVWTRARKDSIKIKDRSIVRCYRSLLLKEPLVETNLFTENVLTRTTEEKVRSVGKRFFTIEQRMIKIEFSRFSPFCFNVLYQKGNFHFRAFTFAFQIRILSFQKYF